jgi:RNase LS, bacterial toxin DBD domain/RNase LS, bacterial toxin/RNase LS, bacterial toxin N-terminal
MPFKQLNLDRSLIQRSIDDFFKDSATKMVQKSDILWEIRRVVENKEMILQFFYLNDGRTTLGYKVGSNQESSRKLAEHIKNNTLVDPRHNVTLSFKNFTQESFNDLTTFLSAVNGVNVSEDRQNPTGQRIVRYTGNQNDSITFVYHTNSTLQLQGRPVTLYCQVIAFLSEYLSLGEVIESQSKFIPVPIKIKDIEYELEAKLPYSYSKLDPTTRKMLGASIAFTKLNIDLPDYSAFAFPALRAMEGQIKALFFEKGISIIGKDGFGDHFRFDGMRHLVALDTANKINCTNTCRAIENLYNYYCKHRHSLFHAEVAPIASTIIEDRDKAVEIVDVVIRTLEDSYRILTK